MFLDLRPRILGFEKNPILILPPTLRYCSVYIPPFILDNSLINHDFSCHQNRLEVELGFSCCLIISLENYQFTIICIIMPTFHTSLSVGTSTRKPSPQKLKELFTSTQASHFLECQPLQSLFVLCIANNI